MNNSNFVVRITSSLLVAHVFFIVLFSSLYFRQPRVFLLSIFSVIVKLASSSFYMTCPNRLIGQQIKPGRTFLGKRRFFSGILA